jgi:SAM-dependent methyltransferase
MSSVYSHYHLLIRPLGRFVPISSSQRRAYSEVCLTPPVFSKLLHRVELEKIYTGRTTMLGNTQPFSTGTSSVTPKPGSVGDEVNKPPTSGVSGNGNTKENVQKMRQKLQIMTTGWDDLWVEGITPWDMGGPTPLLWHELCEQKPPRTSKILVPGCGAGYDLATLARYSSLSNYNSGCVVIGLDLSPTSLQIAAKKVTSLLGNNISEGIDPSQQKNQPRVELRQGDFFSSVLNWELNNLVNGTSSGKKGIALSDFDLILDYTFFCALPPAQRADWGKRVSELLLPETGRLLTIVFPILPEADRNKGPPYPVTIQDYQLALEPHGIKLIETPCASPHSVPSRQGKELVCWWKKTNPPPSRL